MKKFKRLNKSTVLLISSITLLLVSLIFLAVSIYPSIEYRLKYKGKAVYPYESTYVDNTNDDKEVVKEDKKIPEINTLVIPTIGVDVKIVEGSGDWALNDGSWHRPGTGDPIQGGNFVLTGHRFGFSWMPSDIKKKSTFYNLDKVEIGDVLIVYWEGKEYDYKVNRIFSAAPDEVSIEDPTESPQLMVYTCSLLGRNSDRLVLIATPVEQ
ncbi:class E sortase [Candidatus Dojkabacteria bacterium]|uniref:Class E sortase n=1 Tax=Candidatus Dojkabacteria bacterium TaxID=2099670 RepID=A0A955RHI7_9BACT|nr:class E sortase [Candidatus Dojkabacteria bacterium]